MANWERVWTWPNWRRLLFGDLFTQGDPGGLLLTLIIGLSAIVIATLLGSAIGAMRLSSSRWVRIPATLYVQVLRNIPLLILVFWAYFIPPSFGLQTSKFMSVLVALSLFTAAYIAEVVQGGILSVAPGTVEAARVLGLGPVQIGLWVVMPQAFYNMLPSLAGRYVVAIKNTSLAFLIGLADLSEIGKQIGARLMTSPIEVYLTLMLIYFTVNRLISFGLKRLENRGRFNRMLLRV